jgi:hypothetical protein
LEGALGAASLGTVAFAMAPLVFGPGLAAATAARVFLTPGTKKVSQRKWKKTETYFEQ